MNRLKQFFSDYCLFLISSYKFEIIFEKYTNLFGGDGCIIISNKIMSIEFLFEREEFAFYFRNNKDKKNKYYDFDIVKNFLENPHEYQLAANIKKEDIYNSEIQMKRAKEKINYIKNNLKQIMSIFSDGNYTSNKVVFEKLLLYRSKKLFG